jgi:hypothetical protein
MAFPTFKFVFRRETEPEAWDLRGDPELYLSAVLYQVPIPRDVALAVKLVKDTVGNLTGWDCEKADEEGVPVPLSHFQDGTGMSTGFASARWWLQDGFPRIEELISTELQTARRRLSQDG